MQPHSMESVLGFFAGINPFGGKKTEVLSKSPKKARYVKADFVSSMDWLDSTSDDTAVLDG